MSSFPLRSAIEENLINPYPIALNLAGKSCVVIGGGNIATRKVEGLLDSGAKVTVISPTLSQKLEAIVAESRIDWIADHYLYIHLKSQKPVLVIAATDDSEINRQIVEDARRIGAPVNDVTDREQSDFFNMATVQRGNLQVGISTGGASPALMTYLKDELERVLDAALATLSEWLGELRPLVSESIENQSDREAVYRELIASNVLSLLREGQVESARNKFDEIVREHLL